MLIVTSTLILLFVGRAGFAEAPAGFKASSERAITDVTLVRDVLDTPEYVVTLVGDKIRVENRVDFYRHERGEFVKGASKTPGVVIDLGMSKGFWAPGQGVPADSGWLKGFDVGEFGGGLYWFSDDGKRHREISGDNTPIVTGTPDGIFAVQSLSHMMFWYSRLVKVKSDGSKVKLETVTDLHVSPSAVLWDGTRFIYATNDFVSTLETSGTQHEIYRTEIPIRFGSMVRRLNGEIWLGAEGGVLCLRPKKTGDYEPQWYAPKTKKK